MSISVLIVALSFLPILSATTITFVTHGSASDTSSDSITASLTSGGLQMPVGIIPPDPVWANIPGASWISPFQTGSANAPNWVEEPNGTVFWFTQSIFIPMGFQITSATLTYGVDDSSDGWVNGIKIFSFSSSQGVNCSAVVPSCTNGTLFSGDISSILSDGMNTLLFNDTQVGHGPMGIIDSISITGTQTPEPKTLVLFCVSVVVLGLVKRRRVAQ
jgi:hypothetical protein